MPVVSVILAAHNRAHLLKDAIESVLAQTYQDWELIVVNDSSTDSTAELAQAYSRQDVRIHYLYRQHGRAALTKNSGLEQARGAYVALLDDDDTFLPHKLEQQVRTLEERPELGFTYAPVKVLFTDGRSDTVLLPEQPANTFAALFDACLPQVAGVLARRACIEAVGQFNVALPHCEDYDLWLRLARRFRFDYTAEPVGLYRRHAGQKSRRTFTFLETQRAVLQSLPSVTGLGVSPAARRRRLAMLSYELARHHVDAGHFLSAARNLWSAIWWRPDIGLLAPAYREARHHPLYKALKPYAGIAYCSWRGLAYANR